VSAVDGNLQVQHPWEGRAIATHKFRLVEFSAYLELRAEETVSIFEPLPANQSTNQ
jgi:hypothetical protein